MLGKSLVLKHLRKTIPPPSPPCPTLVHEILMPSYRAPFETSEYQFLEKVIYPFIYKALKNQHFFLTYDTLK